MPIDIMFLYLVNLHYFSLLIFS